MLKPLTLSVSLALALGACGVSLAGPRDHVADEFLVPGRVDQHELPPRRAKPAAAEDGLRRVEGEIIPLLLGQAIHHAGEGGVLALGASERFQRGHCRPVERSGLVQESPDQRALAVIEMAAEYDADFPMFGHGCLSFVSDFVLRISIFDATCIPTRGVSA